jgi:hypothetical protein
MSKEFLITMIPALIMAGFAAFGLMIVSSRFVAH